MKSRMQRKTRTQRKKVRQAPYNKPRPQVSASQSIVRGLSGIANQFIPGAGLAVTGVSKLLGFGAYTSADAEKILASRVPEMHATLDRGVRIAHHEYLGDVLSSTPFTATKYPLNPGISTTFPWLSSVATAFQEYELNGAVFFFKSTSANALNSTNTALGQIIGAVQYNPYQTTPVTKLEMLGLSGAADGKPSESNIYPVECKADMTVMRSKLVRSGPVTDDLMKYDHGNFFLGTNGSQAIATVGELHIVYDVWLKKPKLYSPSAGAGWSCHFTSTDATAAKPLGTSVTTFTDNNIGAVVDLVNNKITLPAVNIIAGTKYRVRAYWTGTVAASAVAPIVTPTNLSSTIVGIQYRNTNIASITVPASGSTTDVLIEFLCYAQVSNVDAVLSFGTAGTLPTGTTGLDVYITEAMV